MSLSAPDKPQTYRVTHDTCYRYPGDVSYARQLLHLSPRESPGQHTLAHRLDFTPEPTSRRDGTDGFGNPLTWLEYDRPHSLLEVRAHSVIEVLPRPALCADDSLPWEEVVRELRYHPASRERDTIDACRYRPQSPFCPIKRSLADFAADCLGEGRPILSAVEDVMSLIFEEFAYSPGHTEIGTPVFEVLESRRGVCQDFAHLMIACLRSHGLAVRYVSGYLRTEPPEGMPRLVGADASHAWVSVWCPPFGWVDLDPTNGVRVGPDHITLAWGRDFGDVSPLRGVVLGGGEHSLAVSVTVQPLEEAPAAADATDSAEKKRVLGAVPEAGLD